MLDNVLQSPSLSLVADSTKVLNYKLNSQNYITQMFAAQLPSIKTGFFNVHMSRGFIIQPHWHTNVNELVFIISGEASVAIFNPFTRKLMTYRLTQGQNIVLPKGWFHWIVALKDQTHMLTIFDKPTPDIVYGSDFLRFTPADIMHLAYCINPDEYNRAVAPIQASHVLGPPKWCGNQPGTYQPHQQQYYAEQMQPPTGYYNY
ncbi:cupin domain-containing protein [Metabacillus litoralis]|jgi:oxalate decarboxylase/phosphoglucose isomerase-like protein (cupin superfamily)|uniref:Cupin domain-containing protein n=2 Tax=Metabacillus TaxID=2675233 RepID=A0ABS7URG7_9BACI|nr:cupin domain-containing protein [Metabacillus rhizolycopersici]MBZ5750535.1 cupin domain-containing protein [Metabacillus rhizolycopersici]MCM3653981.1 cupin domain-containing protein [Metabacillus litoralis]